MRHRCFETRRQFDDSSTQFVSIGRKINRDEKEAGRTIRIRFGDSDPRASSPVQRGVAVREDNEEARHTLIGVHVVSDCGSEPRQRISGGRESIDGIMHRAA